MPKLYPYQQKAVDELRSGSILCGGVGSGKSLTALSYFLQKEYSVDHPKDLYIITTAMKRDRLEWDAECAKVGLSKVREYSTIDCQVFVDSWNNIHKYEAVVDAFFIFDEQKVMGNGAWVKSFYKIAKKNHWILATATPGDTWMAYIPVFVANGYYKNRTAFIREHVIYDPYAKFPKIKKIFNTKKLEALRDMVTVNMPCKKTTVTHRRLVNTEYNKDLTDQIYYDRWNPLEGEPIRDIAQACLLMRKVVYTDSSRLLALEDIFKTHPRLIVFYNFNAELELLIDFCERHDIIYAQWNGHVHQPVPESDCWIYLVQYNAGAEAWECTATNVIVFYSQNYSYQIMSQAAGRIDRMNTPYHDLYYYVLTSKSLIDQMITKALKNKKNFNEKVLDVQNTIREIYTDSNEENSIA